MAERNNKGQFVKGHKGYNGMLGKKAPWSKPPHKKGEESSNYKDGICKDMKKYRKEYLVEWRKKHPKKTHEELSKIHSKENLSEKTLEKMRLARKGKWTGKNHYNWKGGINLENERLRHSLEWKIWRNKVYRRDYWTCRLCGKHCQKKDIIAHHIKFFSEYPKLRFVISNGITLCRSCHLKLHNKLKHLPEEDRLKLMLLKERDLKKLN